MYTYPDVIGLCEEPRFEDAEIDTLLNPTVIIEVLSPSTERYDRGEKFAHYRRLESLREYILVAQDIRRIEHYRREGDSWVLTEVSEPDAALIDLVHVVHHPTQRHLRSRGFPERRSSSAPVRGKLRNSINWVSRIPA